MMRFTEFSLWCLLRTPFLWIPIFLPFISQNTTFAYLAKSGSCLPEVTPVSECESGPSLVSSQRFFVCAEKRKGRQVSAAFIYLRPRDKIVALMQAWAGKLTGSTYVDETKAFNDLLGSKSFSNLTIGVLPSAVFPTAEEMTKNSNARLKVRNLS